MIHRLSESIASFYGKKADYSDDKIEVCVYGLELIISDIISVIVVMVAAILTKTVIYTVILLAVFISLRHQAGGFHASSHAKCNMLFFAGYILSVLLVKLISIHMIKYFVIAISTISFVEIFIYAPVSHPNKPVSKNKKKKFRINSLIITSILSIVSIILSIQEKTSKYGLGIALGIFFVGLSVMAETMKQSKNLVNTAV